MQEGGLSVQTTGLGRLVVVVVVEVGGVLLIGEYMYLKTNASLWYL